MSDSLRPHGQQHIRLPCPSPTPRDYLNSCPLSWWCHPTVSSSVVPFSSRLIYVHHIYTYSQQYDGASGQEPTCQCRTEEMQVQDLGRADPLVKEMTTHSSILAWRIPWTEEPGGLPSMGSKSRDTPEWLNNNNYIYIYATGPLCSTPKTLQINYASIKICVPTDKISGFSITSMIWVKYQFKDYRLYIISKQQLYMENMNFDII